MLGAIAGDIIGSVYEFDDRKPDYNFPLFTKDSVFTDDTVLTVALADSIMNKIDYAVNLKKFYRFYPDVSYGISFGQWARSDSLEPYNSLGNGSAMRVSPVGWAYNTLEEVLEKAKQSAEVTHNHPEGIKGAQAVAASIFLLRQGRVKSELKTYIENTFNYNLDLDYDDLKENYRFNELCQQTVPQAIYTFLISDSFEDSIRKAVCIGGDSDTVACINGSLAEAAYGIPDSIITKVKSKLDSRLLDIVLRFKELY